MARNYDLQNTGAEVQQRLDQVPVTQEELAAEVQNREAADAVLDGRLETVEGLAEISVAGGDIQIATAADFNIDDSEHRAKIPTVGAIKDYTDDVPTPGSSKFVKSGGAYADTHLCNVKEVNGFVVDIVLKEGVEIDFSHLNRIWIGDIYGNSNVIAILLSDTTETYPSVPLFSQSYTSADAALAAFGTLMESNYCYIVLRHVGFSGGQKNITNKSLVFNRDISWKSLNEHPIIKALLSDREITDIQADVNSIKGDLIPITFSGTKTGWLNIWSDENNPIPQGSQIENNSEMPILAYDSYSKVSGEDTYYTIPVGESWNAEYPVYRLKTGGAGDYSVNVYYPGSLSAQVDEIDKKVDAGMSSLNKKIDAITKTLYGDSEELPTVVSSSNKPPRIDGTQKSSGFYKNYTVDLTGAYARGYTRVRFYGFSYSTSSDISQGLVATGVENGAWVVESYITPVNFEAGYCELPLTASSTLLVACILTSQGKTQVGNNYPEGTDLNFVPSTVQLLNEDSDGVMEKIDELDGRVTALEEGGTAALKFPATYMPKKVFGVIGDTLQIFRRSVVVSNDPYRQYLDFVCGQGKIFERYLQIVPEKVSGAVPTNLTIKHCLIADDFTKSEEQTSNLVLADRPSSSPASNINVLCIGASTTASGQWPSELKRRLIGTRDSGTPAADGLENITFVGRMELAAASGSRPVTVNVEATGGWTWKTFYTPQEAIRFTVSGVTSVDVGTVYSYTDVNNKLVKISVAEVNVTSGSGDIRFLFSYNTVGKGLPADASGTLTRVSSSGGDATIAYSAAEKETYCPFYDEQTEQPDFAHYASLYCDNQIDVLVAYMGNVNEGIRGDSTDEQIATKVGNMKTLLDAFHADFPSGKVIVGIAALANPWYGYEDDYTAASANKTWSLRYGLYRYVKAVETFLQGNDYKDWCYLADTYAEVDSESGYPTTTKPANTRTNRLDVIGSNGAHPNIEGYQMIADSMYRCFVNTILQ